MPISWHCYGEPLLFRVKVTLFENVAVIQGKSGGAVVLNMRSILVFAKYTRFQKKKAYNKIEVQAKSFI